MYLFVYETILAYDSLWVSLLKIEPKLIRKKHADPTLGGGILDHYMYVLAGYQKHT